MCEFHTKVGRVVVGGAVESEVSQVGNQTGDLPSVDTLTLTQHVQLKHTEKKRSTVKLMKDEDQLTSVLRDRLDSASLLLSVLDYF